MFAQEHPVGIVSADDELVFCLCTVNTYYHLTVESLNETHLLAVVLAVLNIANAVGGGTECYKFALQAKFKSTEVWCGASIAYCRYSDVL